MTISEVAKLTGVSAKMIRHYEEIGLFPKVARTDSGYRSYGETDVHVLRFIKRSRDFGFSMDEIKQLLGLWRNKKRRSEDVKRIAERHVRELEQKILELRSIADALKQLSHCCHGDARPECPILEELSPLK